MKARKTLTAVKKSATKGDGLKMIARATKPTPLGHFEEDQRIPFREVERRLDDLARSGLLPLRVVCDIAADLGRHRQIAQGAIETGLEAKIEAREGIPIEHWAKACEMVCPELYGEPPMPLRPSEALPHTRAFVAALSRRFEAGKGLRNPRDTHGLGADQIPQKLWTTAMIRAERQGTKVVKIAPPSPKADRVRQVMASNPSANLEEIARLARCCTTTVKKVWSAGSQKTTSNPGPGEPKANSISDIFNLAN